MTRPVELHVAGLDVVLMAPRQPRLGMLPAAPTPATQPTLPYLVQRASAAAVEHDTASSEELLGQVGRLLLELLQGRRPAAQARLICADGTEQVVLAARRRLDWTGAVVASTRGCEPAPGVVEGSVRFERDGRSTAVALRLQHHGRGWRCHHFGILLTPARLASLAA